MNHELRQWAWPHVPLILLALVTTFAAGLAMTGTEGVARLTAVPSASDALAAASYAVCVMVILFAHEMGHYLQARRHGVEVSPPYFIPGLPIPTLGTIPFIGTLGAFIKLEMKPMRARQLLDIGAWGPLAGWIVSIPVLMVGMAISEVQPLPEGPEQAMTLGNSVLIMLGEAIFHPEIPAGSDVYLHPMAMAGWTGCLLTALNLLPLGQLDGGHIAYTVFGERFNRVAPILFAALVLLGIFAFAGWLMFAILVWILGIRHPDIVEGPPVRGRDTWLAWASVGMFATTFSAAPIHDASVLDMISKGF